LIKTSKHKRFTTFDEIYYQNPYYFNQNIIKFSGVFDQF